jgi:hypothetical protein
MSEFEREATLRSILLDTAKSGVRVRFFGSNMCILAEAQVVFVGKDVVGLRHHSNEEAEEFLTISSIIKVQVLPDYTHY